MKQQNQLSARHASTNSSPLFSSNKENNMTHATALPLKVNDLLAHSLDRNMLDYWLAKLNPRWSVFKAQATVVDKQQAAADRISLLIKPNRHLH
ncbi:hypothetical protein RJJ65_35970, partial [Rhizobium hidalgonense]